jgi:hypothetical protein
MQPNERSFTHKNFKAEGMFRWKADFTRNSPVSPIHLSSRIGAALIWSSTLRCTARSNTEFVFQPVGHDRPVYIGNTVQAMTCIRVDDESFFAPHFFCDSLGVGVRNDRIFASMYQQQRASDLIRQPYKCN